jgi:L-aspartate oxidase
VFGRRAADAAIGEPEPPTTHSSFHRTEETVHAPELTEATRDALWRLAGLERDRDGLSELTHDDHPLARLIAHSALAREESRGAHRRRDFPELDPSLDGRHVTVTRDADPALGEWR